MSIPTTFFSLIRPITDLTAHWFTFSGILPHFSILAALFGMAWRAALVAEPAGALVFSPNPIVEIPAATSPLVVISANLKHDFPLYRDMEARLEAFADLVEAEHADVLLLQEVARTTDFNVDEWLRNRLGMAYVYARANGHQRGIGFEEGVAIFSRYPLADPEVRDLSSGRNPFTRRIALNASVLLPDGRLEAFSVHLGLAPGGNEKQMDVLKNWANDAATHTAVVVGGDFNAEPQTERIRSLQQLWTDSYQAAGSERNPNTHTLAAPWGATLREHRLDYIFLLPGQSGWIPQQTLHLDTSPIAHSDHRVVVTRLQSQP